MRDGVAGLAVWLVRESLNKDSEWRPYICSLPRHVPLPLFYSQSKLAKVRATLSTEQIDTFDALMEVRRDSFEARLTTRSFLMCTLVRFNHEHRWFRRSFLMLHTSEVQS